MGKHVVIKQQWRPEEAGLEGSAILGRALGFTEERRRVTGFIIRRSDDSECFIYYAKPSGEEFGYLHSVPLDDCEVEIDAEARSHS